MPSAEFLESHPKARAHEWLKKPMQEEEVDVFLAVIIIIGMLGFPRLR